MGVPVALQASTTSPTRLRSITLELAVVATVYLAYRNGRTITRGAADDALRNAADVAHVERALGIFHEQAIQQLVLQSRTLVELLNHYYVAVHFPATVAFLIWAYVRHHDVYRSVRTWFAGVTMLALGLHVAYPLAPPRMTIGFVDTLSQFGPRIYDPDTSRSVANQFAAMPSLHFGWALMVGVSIVVIKRSRLSLLALAHPLITLVAIVATANHYWLDAIVVTVLVVMVGAVVLNTSSHQTSHHSSHHSSHRSRAAEMLPSAVSAVAALGADPGSTPHLSSAGTGTPDEPLVAQADPRPRCHRRPATRAPTPMTEPRERAPVGRGASLTDPSSLAAGTTSS